MRPSCGATTSLLAPSGVSYLVRAVFKDSSFMRRGNLEYIQAFNTSPAPIDLPPRCMLALNEQANQRPDLGGDRLSISRKLGGLGGQEPARPRILVFFIFWR